MAPEGPFAQRALQVIGCDEQDVRPFLGTGYGVAPLVGWFVLGFAIVDIIDIASLQDEAGGRSPESMAQVRFRAGFFEASR